jgi:hypothetical protein
LATGLLITLIVLSFVANHLSRRITMPLVRLADHFNDTRHPEDVEKEAEISVELV